MIIDDSPTIRQVVRTALLRAGFDVIEAEDGSDAMAKLGRKVHLFVCDLNMPNVDGLSFVRQLRQTEEYKFAPVIMLTTESQLNKKIEGKQAGVRAWIVKPFKSDQLISTIEKLLPTPH